MNWFKKTSNRLESNQIYHIFMTLINSFEPTSEKSINNLENGVFYYPAEDYRYLVEFAKNNLKNIRSLTFNVVYNKKLYILNFRFKDNLIECMITYGNYKIKSIKAFSIEEFIKTVKNTIITIDKEDNDNNGDDEEDFDIDPSPVSPNQKLVSV